MIRALYTAATGMEAQQLNIDVIANNLANINTTAYKLQRPEFQDLLYQNERRVGANSSDNATASCGAPTTSGWCVVPRCQLIFEKCAGGLKIHCKCDDAVSCATLQNLCNSLAAGTCSCCCTCCKKIIQTYFVIKAPRFKRGAFFVKPVNILKGLTRKFPYLCALKLFYNGNGQEYNNWL